jgi:hypothetical protein
MRVGHAADDPTPGNLLLRKLCGGQDPHRVAASVKKDNKKRRRRRTTKMKKKQHIFFKHCASNATYFTTHSFQV